MVEGGHRGRGEAPMGMLQGKVAAVNRGRPRDRAAVKRSRSRRHGAAVVVNDVACQADGDPVPG